MSIGILFARQSVADACDAPFIGQSVYHCNWTPGRIFALDPSLVEAMCSRRGCPHSDTPGRTDLILSTQSLASRGHVTKNTGFRMSLVSTQAEGQPQTTRTASTPGSSRWTSSTRAPRASRISCTVPVRSYEGLHPPQNLSPTFILSPIVCTAHGHESAWNDLQLYLQLSRRIRWMSIPTKSYRFHPPFRIVPAPATLIVGFAPPCFPDGNNIRFPGFTNTSPACGIQRDKTSPA